MTGIKKNFEVRLDLFKDNDWSRIVTDKMQHIVALNVCNKNNKDFNVASTSGDDDLLELFLKSETVKKEELDEIWENTRKQFCALILKGCYKEVLKNDVYPNVLYALLNNSRKNSIDKPQDVRLDSKGNTALHLCALRWNSKKWTIDDLFFFEEVVKSNVNILIKNFDGKTAFEVANCKDFNDAYNSLI